MQMFSLIYQQHWSSHVQKGVGVIQVEGGQDGLCLGKGCKETDGAALASHANEPRTNEKTLLGSLGDTGLVWFLLLFSFAWRKVTSGVSVNLTQDTLP